MPFPAQFAIDDRRGDTNDYQIVVTEGGNPVDLTAPGTQLWFTGKLDRLDADNAAVFQKTLSNGIQIIGGGLAVATVSPVDTANLPDETLVYVDAQIRYPSGRIQTITEGTIRYFIDVTRVTS